MHHGQRLSPLEERDLVNAAEAGDTRARRALVEAFLPAIGALARRFPISRGVERQDLVQEGIAALLFAASRFDPSLNTPFWAYASFWVRKAMQELVADLTRPVALSDRAVRDLAQIRTARALHLQQNGTEPTTDELVAATGFSRAQLGSLMATELVPQALEEPAGSGDGAGATVGETIPDPSAEQAFELVLDGIEIRAVRDLTEALDARQRTVIRSHYGLGEPARTLSEIGGALGLTAERARQIEVAALRVLRDALAQPAPIADTPA